VTALPGWYQDPKDDKLLRYWDGHAWTVTKNRSSLINTGNKVQSAGENAGKLGGAILWITIGVG
jgi:hypothetical protein